MEKNENLQNRGEKFESNAIFLDVQDKREKDVFIFIVKEYGGCISVKRFKETFSPIPDDFDDWLSKEKKILSFYKKNGQIIHILAFLRDATICADHINFVTRCWRENCNQFHICKYYLKGNCKFGERCKNGHSFTVGNNKEIKRKLGLSDFSDNEILTILRCKYPQVCPADDCECNVPDECPYLHICYRFTQGLCRYPSCERGHSLEDPHTKWVLSHYEMEDWPKQKPELFNAVISLRKKPRSDSDQDDGSSKAYSCQPASNPPNLSEKENERETEKNILQDLVKEMKEEKQRKDKN